MIQTLNMIMLVIWAGLHSLECNEHDGRCKVQDEIITS